MTRSRLHIVPRAIRRSALACMAALTLVTGAGADSPFGYQSQPIYPPSHATQQIETRSIIILAPRPVVILPGGNAHIQTHTRHGQYLPASCIEGLSVNGAHLAMYETSCLRRQGVDLIQLPINCGVSIPSSTEWRRGFETTCLRRAGYGMAGR